MTFNSAGFLLLQQVSRNGSTGGGKPPEDEKPIEWTARNKRRLAIAIASFVSASIIFVLLV
jgi:hypothetical protein